MQNLDKFHKAKILVVGDVMLDRYWWGTVNRISPEAPVPIVSMQKDTFAPGGAANVALNIAGLGATAFLIGNIGEDQEADCLAQSLRENKVSPEFLIRAQGRATIVKTRIIAHNQQVVRIDREEITELNSAVETSVRNSIDHILPEADVVIISDYAKGFLTRNLLSYLIDRARNSNKIVLVDPKGKDFSKYAGANMITPNRDEAAATCALDGDIPNVVDVAGQKLLSDLDFDSVLITESEKGMTLFRRNESPVHFDAHAQEIYDVTGAGDTVVATLGTALASGVEMIEAVNLANIAAGFAVERVGTTAVTIDMLKSSLGEPKSSRHAK